MQVSPDSTDELGGRLSLLSGFMALPINLASSSMIKYLFYKPLKTRKTGVSTQDADHPDFRTLYITNLAHNCGEKDLTAIFGTCGAIESIRFETRDRPSTSGGVNVAEALAKMLESKKSEEFADQTGHISATQVEYMQSRLRRLERNILGETESSKLTFERSGYALVVFEEESGMEYAMTQLNSMSCFGKSEKGTGHRSHGTKQWLRQWSDANLADPKELQKQADMALHVYDKRLREQKKMEERLATTADDDGWTLVAPRGKKKSVSGGHVVGAASLSQTQLRAIKAEQDKKTHMGDFYKFQQLDMKTNRLENLRRRFAEDKVKMRKMQQHSHRKFSQ